MFKFLLLSLIYLFSFISINAQQSSHRDTVVLYMKNSGEFVQTKDDADFIRLILPRDSSVQRALYPIHDFYLNGQPKKFGTAIVTSKVPFILLYQGSCTSFYPNGHKKNIVTFNNNGQQVGYVTQFYPNGKLYSYTMYNEHNKLLLISCRDSTGRVLAENGKGNWIKLDENTLKLYAQGPIVDSLEDGSWQGILDSVIIIVYLTKVISGLA